MPFSRTAARAATLTFALALTSCASTGVAETPPDPDPLEPVNRAVYRFNDVADRYLIRPVAQGYEAVVPQPVRSSVTRFFENLGMPVVIVNDLLQGKFDEAGQDTARFVVNSTVGIGGLFDPATEVGLPQPNEDLGQTLAVWGVPAGPYLVIPFWGPTTLRDAVGDLGDAQYGLLASYDDTSVRDKAVVLFAINTRARLLGTDSAIENALDPYLFVRDAYLQRREFLIYDGQPPEEDLEDFGLEDWEDDWDDWDDWDDEDADPEGGEAATDGG
jgi:phospholipid-binding lipoprotein MlaA